LLAEKSATDFLNPKMTPELRGEKDTPVTIEVPGKWLSLLL
jgi:hypothetical protein